MSSITSSSTFSRCLLGGALPLLVYVRGFCCAGSSSFASPSTMAVTQGGVDASSLFLIMWSLLQVLSCMVKLQQSPPRPFCYARHENWASLFRIAPNSKGEVVYSGLCFLRQRGQGGVWLFQWQYPESPQNLFFWKA